MFKISLAILILVVVFVSGFELQFTTKTKIVNIKYMGMLVFFYLSFMYREGFDYITPKLIQVTKTPRRGN